MEWHFEIIERQDILFQNIGIPIAYIVTLVVIDDDHMRTYDVQPCPDRESAEELVKICERLDHWYRCYIYGGDNA